MARTKQSKNGHKPTSGKVWRKPREEGYLLTLPSGNHALLRPVELSVLMMDGKIPDLLAPLAAETLWLGVDDDKLTVEGREGFEKIAEIAPEMLKLYNIVARAAFLQPRIVDDPQEDDEISLDDIEAGDKAAVYVWVTNGVRALEFFRDEQVRDVEIVPDGENVRAAAVVADGD